jgi:hypothetical protein
MRRRDRSSLGKIASSLRMINVALQMGYKMMGMKSPLLRILSSSPGEEN